MGQVRDYEALIRELLGEVKSDWGYGNVKGWLMGKVKEPELAQWLREYGADLGADEVVRGQLGYLAGFGRGVLAEVAGELVRGWEPEVDEFEGFEEGFEESCEGDVLSCYQQYEEAIVHYNRAIELNPNNQSALRGKAAALSVLDRWEEVIAICEKAIEIKSDDFQVWVLQGIVLNTLGRYPEALLSLDHAIKIKPDDHEAWSNRGFPLCNLGRYDEAIISFERAIKIKPDDHKTWSNRAVAKGDAEINSLLRHKVKIDAYQEAFQHIKSETHPGGWGYLQHQIGRAHYQEGITKLSKYRQDPRSYYDLALIRYHNALQILTSEEFPKRRLDTLIDTAKVYLAKSKDNIPEARDFQIEAVDILGDLLNAEPTFPGKKRLQLEYITLRQLDVDLFVASGDNIRALETAERDKNNHLTWLLTALDEKIISPKYDQMQQLLTTASGDRKTGIIYWHLSPDHLTTFILHPHNPNPQILTNSSQHLRNWLENYNTDNLDTAKLEELSNILQISQINRHLDGIEHLILIPHRDLHRLPLHSYWQNLTTTYLPSIQIGLNLQAKPQPDRSAGFLLVESPNYSQPTKLKDNLKSLDPLTNPEIEAAIIAHLFQPKTTIPMGEVSKTNLCAAFNTPHTYGHFNGHAYHDSRRPQDSSLVIDGGELTCQDLAQIDLTPYYLISLSACQTGITTHQSIDTEYVGLVSAFLSRGTNYVVSTLWSVKDLPSSMLMMVFYIYIRKGIAAPIALRQAAQWLKNLTYAKEAEFHQNIYQRLPQNSPTEQSTARITDRNRQNAETAAKEQPDAKPYSSQKYWAAFTISGWG